MIRGHRPAPGPPIGATVAGVPKGVSMSSDAAEPGPVIGPRPELPPRPPVPDDRIHGDSLPEAGGGGSTSVHWPPAPTPPP